MKTYLKDGLSGLVRVKNEERFIKPCIESCINSLDELIIVYNDCTDNTPKIIEEMCRKYSGKIRAYAYNNRVLSHNLTEKEFEYACSLPEDSPRLHSNQCNFALSQVNYRYAVKIDVDQLYFADELKRWRDVCSGENKIKWNCSFIIGWLFMIYFSIYRRLSAKIGKPLLCMFPDSLVKHCISSYTDLAKWRLQRKKIAIALSGFNVFKDDRWYIPFDGYNIHPPYNGEGDTLIFNVSDETYYVRSINEKSKTVTERFVSPYKMMFAGPVWFHLHANREYCWYKVKKIKEEHPELFVPVEKFSRMSYKEVHDKLNKKAHSLYQRILFALVHKMGCSRIQDHLSLLK